MSACFFSLLFSRTLPYEYSPRGTNPTLTGRLKNPFFCNGPVISALRARQSQPASSESTFDSRKKKKAN